MCNCRRLVILFFPGFWNNLLKITVVILTTFWICATHLKLFNAWLRGFTSAINLNEIIPSPGEMSTFPPLSEAKTDKTQRSLPKPKILTPQWPLGSMICHSWKPYSFPWVKSRLFALKLKLKGRITIVAYFLLTDLEIIWLRSYETLLHAKRGENFNQLVWV